MEAGAETQRGQGSGARSRARIVVALLVAVLVGLGVGLGVHLLTAGTATAPSAVAERFGLHGEATWAEGVRPAPASDTLRDQTGRLFSMASLRGQTVAVVFFDSHCHQECPLEGRALAAAERSVSVAQRPVVVAISVNPLDTPRSAARAARAWGLTRRALALADWYPPPARPGVGGVPRVRLAAPGERRHRPHRSAVRGRSPRVRAVGLPVAVREPVRDAGSAHARALDEPLSAPSAPLGPHDRDERHAAPGAPAEVVRHPQSRSVQLPL